MPLTLALCEIVVVRYKQTQATYKMHVRSTKRSWLAGLCEVRSSSKVRKNEVEAQGWSESSHPLHALACCEMCFTSNSSSHAQNSDMLSLSQ